MTVNSTELVILLHAVLKEAEHLEGSIILSLMGSNITQKLLEKLVGV